MTAGETSVCNDMLKELNDTFRYVSKDFYHSTPLAGYDVKGKHVEFDLRDMLLIGAITGANMMLTSSTGGGKTTMAKMMMKSLFGDNYAFLPVDTKLDESKLRDIAFRKIKEGGNLSDAVTETKIMTAPGVVVDEYNRTVALQLNSLQNYLTNGTVVFEGGREMQPGVRFEDGDQYQIKVGTMNEGRTYTGAQVVDKASRDRWQIEINLDVFPVSTKDMQMLISNGRAKTNRPGKDNLDKLKELYKVAKKMPVKGAVEEFFIYFMRMNQCIKSPEGTKLTINDLGSEYCKGCSSLAGDKEICSSVYAPSNRTMDYWKDLSKTFALYRAYKTNDSDPEVMIGDVIAAAPFVLYSKMSINPNWVAKYGKRSAWNAINTVVKMAFDRWSRGMKANTDVLEKFSKGAAGKEYDTKMGKYAETDPWFVDLRYVKEAYISREKAAQQAQQPSQQ